jgi:hypothetical protein
MENEENGMFLLCFMESWMFSNLEGIFVREAA